MSGEFSFQFRQMLPPIAAGSRTRSRALPSSNKNDRPARNTFGTARTLESPVVRIIHMLSYSRCSGQQLLPAWIVRSVSQFTTLLQHQVIQPLQQIPLQDNVIPCPDKGDGESVGFHKRPGSVRTASEQDGHLRRS